MGTPSALDFRQAGRRRETGILSRPRPAGARLQRLARAAPAQARSARGGLSLFVPEGSSLFERVERDPGYLAELGFAHLSPAQGAALMTGEAWEFPAPGAFHEARVLRSPGQSHEGLAISGLSARELQELLFRTAWVAGWLTLASGSRGARARRRQARVGDD